MDKPIEKKPIGADTGIVQYEKQKETKFWKWRQDAKKEATCPTCAVVCTSLSIDHIVPLMVLDSFALTEEDAWFFKYEFEDNFQMICWRCNQIKGYLLDFSNPKTVEILHGLLAPYTDQLVATLQQREIERIGNQPKRDPADDI